RLDEWAGRLDEGIDAQVLRLRAALHSGAASLRALRPQRTVAAACERLAAQEQRLGRALIVRQARTEERLAALAGRLHALSPLAVIARGYAVVRTPEGRVVRQLADAPVGSRVAARVGDGWIDATVDGQRRQGLKEPS